MPDTKITALTAISTVDPAVDVLPIVDVSDTTMAASGTTKKITSNQILGAGGTATLASATITGDLTCNSNVNVGASPAFFGGKIATNGHIAISAGNYLKLWNSTGTGVAGINASAADTLNFALTNAFTTAMTLNSTGLGVGGSPAFKLDVAGAANSAPITLLRLNNNGTTGGGPGIAARLQFNAGSTALGFVQGCNFASGAIGVQISGDGTNIHQTIDSSGNVGVGVTPSAWGAAYKAVQQQFGASFFTSNAGSIGLGGNCYNNGTNWLYASGNPATRYEIGPDAGNHRWFIAPSGTAGNAITFTQAMTLDASGNLLVRKTVPSGSTLGCELLANGQINGATANLDNLNIYNTTAAAYRFYVSSAGTIFATNTTISAISDARFKENVEDIDVGLGAILALKPRKFDWKDGKGKNIKGDRGFIAQEFEQVFPNLIDEWKDAAPEGEAPYKSVRQDLIPVLVKAIQELAAEVNALKNA